MEERCDDISNLLNTNIPDINIKMDLAFVQDLFAMQDVQKWLKLNSTNNEQIKYYEEVENIMQKLSEKLYVPDLSIENA